MSNSTSSNTTKRLSIDEYKHNTNTNTSSLRLNLSVT
jgi:hypothetical protein